MKGVQNHIKRWGHEECAGTDELQVAYACNCVSSNFLCTVLCKILRYHLRLYVILHFNEHN